MDMIRWPYKCLMKIPDEFGVLQEYPVQWGYSRPGADLFPYPHSFGSGAYYPDHGFDIFGPGELVERGRVRNRVATLGPNPHAPCPDDAAKWNPPTEE